MVSKKGLSDVVSNVLIILIVVAAVAILGLIVINIVKSANISTASFMCTQLEIEPTSCTYAATGASLASGPFTAKYVISRKDSFSNVQIKAFTTTLTRQTPTESVVETISQSLDPLQTYLKEGLVANSVPLNVEVNSVVIVNDDEEDYTCAANKKIDCTQLISTLTITRSGAGTGTVAGTGINCGADCNEQFNPGQTINLTATASATSTFGGWSGCTSVSGNTCNVLMSESKTVNAIFNSVATPAAYTLNVSNLDSANTRILSSPSGVICGSDCSEVYPSGTFVTLTASGLTSSGLAGSYSLGSLNSNKLVTVTRLASSGAPGGFAIQWSIS